MKLHKDWQAWLNELTQSHKSADAIALGGAVGTLIAIFPTPGFNVLLGVLTLAALPGMNKLALFGALAVWNPIICTPLYAFASDIGSMLLGPTQDVNFEVVILDQHYSYSRGFLAGIGIIAVITSLIIYAGLWSISTWRRPPH